MMYNKTMIPRAIKREYKNNLAQSMLLTSFLGCPLLRTQEGLRENKRIKTAIVKMYIQKRTPPQPSEVDNLIM
jgi:hypothetical protein